MVLPLAHEYQVKATLQKCEDWLLTKIEFIVGEVTGHTKATQKKVEFLQNVCFMEPKMTWSLCMYARRNHLCRTKFLGTNIQSFTSCYLINTKDSCWRPE